MSPPTVCGVAVLSYAKYSCPCAESPVNAAAAIARVTLFDLVIYPCSFPNDFRSVSHRSGSRSALFVYAATPTVKGFFKLFSTLIMNVNSWSREMCDNFNLHQRSLGQTRHLDRRTCRVR